MALVATMTVWTLFGWVEGKQGIPGGLLRVWGKEGGNGEVHWVSLVFFLWATAMVSKTLRVPKP